MLKLMLICAAIAAVTASGSSGQLSKERDVIPTSGGDLAITFIGHGSLMFTYGSRTIHVDPYGSQADYSALPKADVILITHEHGDHLDAAAIGRIRVPGTRVILNEAAAKKIEGGTVMKNGDRLDIAGIAIEAVPAYNIVHKRPDGSPFHPKGIGNGYVLTFGDCRVYVAGDTESIPEMKNLKNVTVAFLPVNLPYTMTLDMAAESARTIRPKILYPYHYGDTDIARLPELLKGEKGIEVRIRAMK